MSGLQITVTPAGRNAIVNAENTGTAPMLIAQIGVTASAFDPSAATALPSELKRLSTFAGLAVADDTVHVTIRDDSSDVYTMRGFALYLSDGTVFAIYGQAEPILEKSSQAMLLLAADIRLVQIDATSLTFGDTNWINPPASATVAGVVELATDAEAIGGTDPSRAMTPAAAKATLDARLGNGAPSAFVKSLLALATAAAIRIALALKSAALKDEGHGNGLDADLLDGQHGAYYSAWGNLTGKPATFAPGPHAHPWSDVSGAPETATRWPAWGEVSGKPLAFAPTAHGHAWGDLSGVPETSTRWPAWGEVTGKPAAFAPTAHGHSIADIGGLAGALDSKQPNLGFTPVRQGGGAGQGANAIFIGWGGADVLVQVDATNLGAIAFKSWAAPIQSPAFQGTVSATGTISAPLFAQSSSRRYKTSIRTLSPDDALALLLLVRLTRYRLKTDGSMQLGVIAEELADGPLDFVVTRTLGGDPEGVNYQPLLILACAALQGLEQRVAVLEAKV